MDAQNRKELVTMFGDLLPFGGLVVGIITIAAGVIVLVWPRIIAYIIGIYLIIAGLLTVLTVWR